MSTLTSQIRYAVIDLAVAEDLAERATRLRPPAGETLLDPKLAQKGLAVGPWLVDLRRAEDIAEALAKRPKAEPWGYFVTSSVDLLSLRRTLRRYNMATIKGSDRQLLFRYWDPRIMAVFLRVATPHQRERLFEWIDRIEALDGSFDVRAPSEAE